MMSKGYLRDLLQQAAVAHHEYETKSGKPDANWSQWYAQHMLEQMRNDFGRSPSNPLEYPRHA